MSAGIRDFVRAISVAWLQNGNAEKFLYVMGLAVDECLEKLNQGIRLRMPTYGDPSALPYIGADRLITQGITEAPLAYGTRLKAWLDDWQIAGNARSVLQQELGEVTAFVPMARTVTEQSVWDTYIEGADPQTTPPSHYWSPIANWNWDSDADPHHGVQPMWWRYWLILFTGQTRVGGSVLFATVGPPIVVTTSSPHGLSTGATVAVTGVHGNLAANGSWTVTVLSVTTFSLDGSTGSAAYTSGGIVYASDGQNWIGPGPVVGQPGVKIGDPRYSIGFNKPSGIIKSARAVASLWKGAHSWCRWVIVSFDNKQFDPFQPIGGGINPDGTWGPMAVIVNHQYVASPRSPDARYCDGTI